MRKSFFFFFLLFSVCIFAADEVVPLPLLEKGIIPVKEGPAGKDGKIQDIIAADSSIVVDNTDPTKPKLKAVSAPAPDDLARTQIKSIQGTPNYNDPVPVTLTETKSTLSTLSTEVGKKADKSYVDTELAKKEAKGTAYTKTETDTKLVGKADKGESYTKVEDDGKLALKADKTALDAYKIKSAINGQNTTVTVTDGVLKVDASGGGGEVKTSQVKNDSAITGTTLNDVLLLIKNKLFVFGGLKDTDITNGSNAVGDSVQDALNYLSTSDGIENKSTKSGKTVTEALNSCTNDIIKLDISLENIEIALANIKAELLKSQTSTRAGFIGKFSDIENDSTYPGANGKDVIDAIKTKFDRLSTGSILNSSKVPGVNLTAALNELFTKVGGVASLMGGTGALDIQSTDTNRLEITRDGQIIKFKPKGSGGGGIEKLNGLTDKEQSFDSESNTQIEELDWKSEGGVHKLLVPVLDEKSTAPEGFLAREDFLELMAKPDKKYIDTELAKKANIGDSYLKSETFTKGEINTNIATAVTPKADKSYVDTELTKKEDKGTAYSKTESDNKYQPKGDYATNKALDDGLALKQDKGDYATNTALNEGLNKKQDKGDYALKSDIADMETKTHAGQTYQPKGEYIGEAPKDGKQYARQNAAWSEVKGGGGDSAIEITEYTAKLTKGKVWEVGDAKYAGFHCSVTILEEEDNGSDTWRQAIIGNAKNPTSEYSVMWVTAETFKGSGVVVPYLQITRLQAYEDETKNVKIFVYRKTK